MSRTLHELGESKIIEELTKTLPKQGAGLRCGIGDDATVLAPLRSDSVVTTDVLQQGIHFNDASPWDHVGYKALQVNLSDVAAMGARPRFFWLSIALPKNFLVRDLQLIRKGLRKAATEHNILCAGGNTCHAKTVSLSITLLGEGLGKIVYRKGARVGDDIYVTGTLGEAALGLKLLRRSKPVASGDRRYCRRHTQAVARVKAGQALARLGAHAMIDVSDGLLCDLGHILKASKVGAELSLAALQPRTAFRKRCAALRIKWPDLVLSGGEDYELLFCAGRSQSAAIQRLSNKMKLPITKIGQIRSGCRLICYDESGQELRLKRAGYDHFQ